MSDRVIGRRVHVGGGLYRLVMASDVYASLMERIGERVRTCCWTPADAMACGAKLQERYLREYGRPMPA